MDTATMLVAARTLTLILADLDRTEAALAAARRRPPRHRRCRAAPSPSTPCPRPSGSRRRAGASLVLDARDRLAAVRAAARPTRRRGGHVGRLRRRTAPATRAGLAGAYARELGLAAPDAALAHPAHPDRRPRRRARLHRGRARQARGRRAHPVPYRDRRGRGGQRAAARRPCRTRPTPYGPR